MYPEKEKTRGEEGGERGQTGSSRLISRALMTLQDSLDGSKTAECCLVCEQPETITPITGNIWTEFRDPCQGQREWMFFILPFLALNRDEDVMHSIVGGPPAHTATSFGLLLSVHTTIAPKAPQHLLSTEDLPPVKFFMQSHLR